MRQREIFHLPFYPQITEAAQSPTWVAVGQATAPSFTAFPGRLQGVGADMNQYPLHGKLTSKLKYLAATTQY